MCRSELPSAVQHLTILLKFRLTPLARRTAKPRGKLRKPKGPIDAGESRAAVALTVAWMLTLMSTASAQLVATGFWLLMQAAPAQAGARHPLEQLSKVMMFVALATGALCLVFTVLAHRVRHNPPPRSITVTAVLVGLAPLVTIAILALRG